MIARLVVLPEPRNLTGLLISFVSVFALDVLLVDVDTLGGGCSSSALRNSDGRIASDLAGLMNLLVVLVVTVIGIVLLVGFVTSVELLLVFRSEYVDVDVVGVVAAGST